MVKRAGRRPAAHAPLELFAAVLLLLIPALASGAETVSAVTISSYASVLRSGDRAALAAVVGGSLELRSAGNRNVKGVLQLDSWIAESLAFDIPRAYLKVRFPWFRLTLGRTRVSWGDGLLFNAGDVVFGGMGPVSGDLSAETLRNQTAWLGVLYVPLGPFSFLEAVIMPYPPPGPSGSFVEDLLALGAPVRFGGTSEGVRGAVKLGRTTMEGGLFYSGTAAEYRPYLSAHGHLLVDWTLSASAAVPGEQPRWKRWADWLSLSAGVFELLKLPGRGTFSFRLEAALEPGSSWRELPGGTEYALYLFPEISYAPSDTVSLQLRGLLSPLDRSALGLAGVSWNVYQGLTVFGRLAMMAGDRDDLYGWDRDSGVSWTSGLEFVY